jgi:hypothetical protein
VARSRPRTETTGGSREIRHWQAVTIIAALALFFFKDILLGNAYLWEDFLYFSFPVRNFAATSLARGEFPLWNPYTFNGMPFFADIQTAVLYIPCLLLTFFVRDGYLNHYWLQLFMVFHYILAGVTMYALAVSIGLRRLPSLFAGVAYMLSAFMILHAIHQQIVTMAAWFPLILLLFRRVLALPGWLWVCLTGLVIGHSILAGYPQLTVYLYFFLFVYFLYELFTTYRGSAVVSGEALGMMLRAAAVIALSLGLATVQLLPTLELSELSQRAVITYGKSTEGQMSWGQLLTILFPKLFGVADASAYNYWGPGVYWYYWETTIYRGAIPLILTVLSALFWKKHRLIPFLWGFSVFGLLFAVGDHFFLHRIFYAYVPGFSSFRCPARMLAFMGIAVGLLSGFSIQEILYGDRRQGLPARWRTVVFGTAGTAVLIWLLLLSGILDRVLPFLSTPAVNAKVRNDLNVSIVVVLLSAALIVWLIIRGSSLRWGFWGLLGVTFFDLLLFGGSQNNAKLNPTDYFRRPQEIIRYIRQMGGPEYFRVNTRNERGMIMDRNQGMVDRLFMMEGYTPLALQRVYPPVTSPERMLNLLNVKFRTVNSEAERSIALAPHTGYLPRAFMAYELRVIPDEKALAAELNSESFDPALTALLETDPGWSLPAESGTPSWKANIREYGINAIVLDVQTDRDGLLVLSEIHYPGWSAYVDGTETPLYRTNYNLRGTFVPRGSHTVEVRFQPQTLFRGLWISLGSLLLCSAGIVIPLTKRRNARVPKP